MDNKVTKSYFFKDISGDVWFLGVYSNNYQDRQDEIISTKAHEDFIQWANTKGIKPPIILMHSPRFPDIVHLAHLIGLESGRITAEQFNDNLMKLYKSTAIAQTVVVKMSKGFTFVLGKVLPERLTLAKKLMENRSNLGMSHGFIPLRKSGSIIEGYRSFEFTVAPISLAANELTAIGFSGLKDIGMSDVLDTLPEEAQALLNDEKLEEATEKAREIVGDLLASKTLETPVEEKQPEQQPEAQYATLRSNLFADFKLEELQSAFKQVSDKITTQDALITKLSETVEILSKTVLELKKSDDEKIANQFRTPDWTPNWKVEPTKAETEKIQQLKEALPETIVEKPADKGKDNALNLGFWSAFSS